MDFIFNDVTVELIFSQRAFLLFPLCLSPLCSYSFILNTFCFVYITIIGKIGGQCKVQKRVFVAFVFGEYAILVVLLHFCGRFCSAETGRYCTDN